MNDPAKKRDEGTSKSGAASFIGKLFMLVVGAVLAGLGGYIWSEYIKPKPIYVNIQVFDDSTPPNSLKNVAVWLGLKDVEPKHTVDFGVVRFEIPRKHRSEQVTPQLQLQGYSPIQGQNPDKVILDRSEKNVIFVLKKNAPLVSPPTFEPRPTVLVREPADRVPLSANCTSYVQTPNRMAGQFRSLRLC